MATTSDVTELLDAWSAGDKEALDELMPLVINDLRRMAGAYLARESPGHTLQPTALVNELYLRLAGRRTVQWESRTQFFASMAEIMRRILVDHARHRKAAKLGGGAPRLSFDEAIGVRRQLKEPQDDLDLVALDEALKSLAEVDPRQSRIVELRFFGGMSVAETADAVGVSAATVKREWRVARAWLFRHMDGGASIPGTSAG